MGVFTFFKLYKWYQITQSFSYKLLLHESDQMTRDVFLKFTYTRILPVPCFVAANLPQVESRSTLGPQFYSINLLIICMETVTVIKSSSTCWKMRIINFCIPSSNCNININSTRQKHSPGVGL